MLVLFGNLIQSGWGVQALVFLAQNRSRAKMKILHTSDLHIGRQFAGFSMGDDHDAILAQIVDAIGLHEVAVLIIAGDIFDRAAPPASAVRQFNRFNRFLSRVANETGAAVVMIAGNHDSGDRIASMSIMTDPRRALIRGTLSAEEKPLILDDGFGPVALTALPFAYEYAARECFNDESIASPQNVLTRQLACARPHVPEGARWVVVAHAFVAGASPSESERPLTRVGGMETVSPTVFDGAHYVALGHLHRAQSVGAPHIHYSGSPLALGFDETDPGGAAPSKSMSLVSLDGNGKATIETIPFCPIRSARVMRGAHADLLREEPSQDFIKVVLTDRVPVIDAMKRLREIFPHACELAYERTWQRANCRGPDRQPSAQFDPLGLVGDFLEHVREERLTDAEQEIVEDALRRLREQEDAQ